MSVAGRRVFGMTGSEDLETRRRDARDELSAIIELKGRLGDDPWEFLPELPDAEPVMAAVDAVSAEALRRADVHPNVDLALAALSLAARLPADAGVAVFAIGRLVGWIAHALDEYEQRPLRLRPRGRYVGP